VKRLQPEMPPTRNSLVAIAGRNFFWKMGQEYAILTILIAAYSEEMFGQVPNSALAMHT
jgi:hypothetical protein